MSEGGRRWGQYLREFIIVTTVPVIAYFLAQQLLTRLDPDAAEKQAASRKALAAKERLQSVLSNQQRQAIEGDNRDEDEDEDGEKSEKRVRPDELVLNQYEQSIAMEVVSPEEIPVTFDDIGGLDEIIEELRESVIYPLTMPHLYSRHSSLLTAPSGVLLYGPPGCGKTMLAKALARESGACFINLHISTLTEKWYGDSNKLVAAVFSLARKLQPTIVFIDEIDAVLGQRRSGEHEASGMVKAEFMTHWDGLASSTVNDGLQRICILGATNRMQDIDEAILRRMPKKFPVSLPNAKQRKQIFELTLRDTKVDDHVSSSGKRAFDITALVRVSAGMSGSDIKEACRDAAMVPVREAIKMNKANGKNMSRFKSDSIRGLRTGDFFGHRGGVRQLQTIDAGAEYDDESSQGSGSTEEVDEFNDAEPVD